MQLRPYQLASVEAIYHHLRTRNDNPCAELPTASGKTPCIGQIARDVVQKWGGRVLILAHVKELLEQAVDKLHSMSPDLWNRIGVYSAGLKSRDTDHPIIVAGIQSVYRRAAELGRFDLIIIDECHLIPPDGEGMYRTFLADAKIVNPNVRLIGFTATPYRMSTGTICGPDNLLHHICYRVGIRELIADGYLCPLRSKAGTRKVDASELHIRAGEFVPSEVESLLDVDELVSEACAEIVEYTVDRRAVLIFAAGVEHAKHVQAAMERVGHECGFVCGETPPIERAETLQRFRCGDLKYLVNVNVLTTGFDAPNIDCVVLLRITNSPGLLYQMVGRGFRLHPGKADCLVLDFGGNILRHGPIDDLRIEQPGSGNGEAPSKECPQCRALIHAAYAMCPECGFVFPQPERQRHGREASSEGILSGAITDTEYEIQEAYYSVHRKRNAPDDHPRTMKVEYRIAYNSYVSEWICFEHTGYARDKAVTWWRARSIEPVPATASEAVELAESGALAKTVGVTVRRISGQKYDRIIAYRLLDTPPPLSTAVGIDPDDTPF